MINFGKKEMMNAKTKVFKTLVFKTLVLALIIILFCLAACDHSPRDDFTGDNDFGSLDGMQITVYLDGGAPAGRALTPELAKMGCDYFEVTFFYNADNNYSNCIVARGEWPAGKTAIVNGVHRTAGGVNYGNVEVTYNYREVITIIWVEVPDPLPDDPYHTILEERQVITYEIDTIKTPAVGIGAAILFAGKSDKTLMAVGRLSAVNNGSGNITSPLTITNDTKSVTFTLAALTAAVNSTAAQSSFKTSENSPKIAPDHTDVNAANTDIRNLQIFKHATDTVVANKSFPLFYLGDNSGRDIKATYTFGLSGGSAYNFDAYRNGGIFISTPAFGSIIPGIPPVPVEGVPAEIVKKQPRYTSYNAAGVPLDNYHESILMLDENTVVMIDNNNIPHAPFDPEVKFSFYTSSTLKGSVFSMVFSIPVYALREVDRNGIKSRWYIRSSYGPSLYDLDDGTRGMGGAVLLGMGVYQEPDVGTYNMRIVMPPTKWQYFDKSRPDDRIFNINGLVVVLETLDEPPMVVKTIPFAELVFKLGSQDKYGRQARWTGIVDPSLPPPSHDERYPWTWPEPLGTPYRFPDDFYGCIEIKVEYTHTNGTTYYGTFYLLISTKGTSNNQDHDFASLTQAQVAHIYDRNYSGNPSWNGNINTSAHAPWDTFPGIGAFTNAPEKFRHVLNHNDYKDRTIIIIVHNSFDIFEGNGNSNPGVPRMYFVMAADDGNTPPVTIGRGYNGAASNLNSIIYQMENPGLNSFYMGIWPFSGTPAGVTFGATKPFTVNSVGPSTGANTANSSTTYMFRNNTPAIPGSGMYNFKLNGLTVLGNLMY